MRRERYDEIIKYEKDINMKLFQKHFDVQRPSLILKSLYSIDDKETNNDFSDMVGSSLTDLKDNLRTMFQNENKIEQPDRLANIVEKILDFNNQNQKEQGLKILTLDQMLSRLPITLVQLKQ